MSKTELQIVEVPSLGAIAALWIKFCWYHPALFPTFSRLAAVGLAFARFADWVKRNARLQTGGQ